VSSASTACLSDQAALLFVERDLSADEAAAVKQHIDRCPVCRELISEVARSLLDGEDGAVRHEPAIGRYTVRGVLGAGAMGIVYAGHDPELDRPVALKVLLRSPDSAEPDADRRLQREAQAMARLSHPNVITVYDVGTVAGRPFVAMELVEGRTLTTWLLEERPPWRDVLRVFILAGRGLSAAHDVGIVHRDFKPDNVLVGHDGRVRVTDFGLARHRAVDIPPPAAPDGLDGRAGPLLTRSGVFAGTPAYMAPEQFELAPVDARTDQFGFCVALFEALFGERPFDGKTFDALAESVRAGRIKEVTSPDGSGVPLRVRRAVLRGLSRAPAERWSSMSDLLAELTAASAPPSGRRWALRVGLAVVVVALAGFTVLGVVKLWRADRDAMDLLAAQRKRDVAAGDLDSALARSEEIVTLARHTGDERRVLQALAEEGVVMIRQGRLTPALGPLDEALGLARALHDPAMTLPVLETIAQTRTNLAQFDAAKPFYDEATAMLEAKGDHAGAGELASAAGVAYLEQLDLPAAERTFDAALVTARAAKDARGEGFALAGLGAVHEYRGELAVARTRYEEWLMLSLAVPDLGSLAKASLAILAMEDGRYADAESLARASAAHFEGAHDRAMAAYSRAVLAWALLEERRSGEATDEAARALEAIRGHEVQRLRHTVETIAATVGLSSGDPARSAEGDRLLERVEGEARASGTWREIVWAHYARARSARAAGDARAPELLDSVEREARVRGLVVVADLAKRAR
jgi:tetratricopeptide (TPR) repeat protein